MITDFNAVYSWIYSIKSATNIQIHTALQIITYINMIHKNGPRTDPWGTPKLAYIAIELKILILY